MFTYEGFVFTHKWETIDFNDFVRLGAVYGPTITLKDLYEKFEDKLDGDDPRTRFTKLMVEKHGEDTPFHVLILLIKLKKSFIENDRIMIE